MKQISHMKQTLRKWISVLLAACLLFSAAAPTVSVFATSTYTAELSSTTMAENGSITVTFAKQADEDNYYNVQIADSSWSTTYVNTNITSGDSYTISGYTAGTYQICIGYYNSSRGWVYDALSTTTFTVTENGAATYAVSITPSATTCEQNESITFTATVTNGNDEIDLSNQSDVYLRLWADSWADGHSSGLTDCSISPSTGLVNSVTIEFPSVGTYYIAYTLEDSSGSEISKSTDVATITVTESTAAPSTEITTGDLSCGFMRGMDLSTFYTNWENGAVYYDYDGNEYSKSKGNAVAFFQFLYDECGVDWIRLRVWNDPYDEDGNPYGGGNNDVNTAAIIGGWASEAGMTVLIDFHYSDFWADPGRQLAPKKWADMAIDEKVTALYTYTYESLETLLKAGVNVGMVQVGNETNGAFCGEKITTWGDYDNNEDWQNMVKLFSSGSKAVRDISAAYGNGTNIKVALHFTNPNNNNPSWYCNLLVDAGVDFDAIGISYYMYWHGTLGNLANEINIITNTYGKEAFIAETAYPYSGENYDGMGNQITSFDDFDMNANLYAISEDGQEAALTSILGTLSSTSCTGLFYWEPAWTALPDTYDAGTGWATKWAGDYISYSMSSSEGSSFDNQALFGNDGKALPALKYYVDFVEGAGNLPEHNYVLDEEASIASACTAAGENVYVCSGCGDSYTETVAAKGHDYGTPAFSWSEDYSACTATFTCGNDSSHVQIVTCTVDSQTNDATCTDGGETVFTATATFNGTDYSNEQAVAIPAVGHTAGEAVVENNIAATCTEAGSYDSVVYCTVCSAELSRETVTVPATGHSYEATEVVASTYADQGYTIYTCPACGDSYAADYTDVLVLDEEDGSLDIRQNVESLAAVPDGLAHMYADMEELRADLISKVTVQADYTEENTAVYDVTLQYRVDGGAWVEATEDNFPVSGITVTIPYPEGTDSSYEFVVEHMFTVTSERLGITAGDTERPTVTKTEDGLVVTLMGLSPVAVSWKAVKTAATETETTDISSQTDNTTDNINTDTSGISAVSTVGAQTGDNSPVALWLALLSVSGAGLIGGAAYNKKRKYNR